MTFYDAYGNVVIPDGSSEPPFLSSSIHSRMRESSDFDASEFDLIKSFTAFPNDYSTQISTPRVLDISSDTFLSTFYDGYLGVNNGVVVTKKDLGKDQSDQYTIWAYDFIPAHAKKKVLLSSGMHTYELPASFGLARWVKELMESNDAVFQYLRENVQFSIIPIINPWGFNQNPKKYGNMNGVNPARNFDDWTGAWATYPSYSPDPSASNYNEWNVKGSAPFSEEETKILATWMRHNTDADFHIDCHTGLGCPRSSATTGDVWTYYSAKHPYKNRIIAARNALLTYLSEKYHTTAYEYETIDNPDVSNHRYYNTVVGVPTMTLEQYQGNDTLFATVPNNSSIAIQEYATQLHAFIISQLQN